MIDDSGTNSHSVLARLDELERQNRLGKVLIGLAVVFVFSAAMTQRAPNPTAVLTTSQINFVRSNGRLFATLAVDESEGNLTISGEDGKQRLWISGLAGINRPPFTAITLADPAGRMHVYLSANTNEAGITLSTPNDQLFTVDGRLPSTSRLVMMKVNTNAGSLSFVDPGDKLRLQIPN